MSTPSQSVLNEYLKGAYFYDSFSRKVKYENQTALEMLIDSCTRIPQWISILMKARNTIVSCLGLKNLGNFEDIKPDKDPADYSVGDRVSIFTLLSQTPNEVVVEDCDKHLNVRISFLIEPQGKTAIVHATTVVHVNNTLGKIYMFFVTPLHKIIVPSLLNLLV